MESPLTRTLDLLLFLKRNISASLSYGPRFCSKKERRGGSGANYSPRPTRSPTDRHYLDYKNLSLILCTIFVFSLVLKTTLTHTCYQRIFHVTSQGKDSNFLVFHFVPTPVIYFSIRLRPLICRFADLKVDKNKNGL